MGDDVIEPRSACPLIAAVVAGLSLFAACESGAADRFPSAMVKIISVCTPERSPYLPDVPTMSEAGLPGFISIAWFGLVAPPDTPEEIVARINEDVVDVLKSEDVRKKFLAHGAEPIGNTPQDMAAFVARERALWGSVIDKANLKAE
jgi:tripartite-type tricarboxylate transporter receptor subunit TctC